MNPRVFREYDIRGNGDADFPDDFVADLGRAAGAYFADKGARRITLGRDCRLTSPRIHATLKRELLAAGLDVIDVGIVHTPGAVFLRVPPGGGRRRDDHRQPQPGRGQRLQDRLRAGPPSTAPRSRSCASGSRSARSAPARRPARRASTTS